MLLRFNDFEVCTASAPGKVILFGEHAVVYGMTAIAASISDLRIFVKISPNPLSDISVILHDIRTEEAESFTHSISFELLRTFVSENQTGNPLIATNPDDWLISLLRVPFKNLPAAASQCLMSITYLVQRILPELTLTKPDTGLFIDVRSEGLPIGAGLGSSAAFSVALAGSLLRLRSYVCKVSHSDNQGRAEGVAGGIGITPSHELLASINAWAYASEVVIHGTPSGLDNTTSCYGGAVKFKKGEDSFQRLIEFPQIRILLTNTKVPRR
jgi:mevalonate kinase